MHLILILCWTRCVMNDVEIHVYILILFYDEGGLSIDHINVLWCQSNLKHEFYPQSRKDLYDNNYTYTYDCTYKIMCMGIILLLLCRDS